MDTLNILSARELGIVLTIIFDSKRNITPSDFCEILQNGEIANNYPIGNSNTKFRVEFKKNGKTHRFYVIELADYIEDTDEYNIIGYVLEQ